MNNDELKLPPGREPLRSDWFIEQLGNSQQKVMSLTVQVRALKKRVERAEERAEILEELVMDIMADCREGVKDYEIAERIDAAMQKLGGDNK
jgi:Xaa-Pro aminopeptidase